MTREEIDKLRVNIEALEQNKHKDIMVLLHKHGVKLSFNRNGCFINLSMVSKDVLIALQDYLNNEFDDKDSVTIPAAISAATI